VCTLTLNIASTSCDRRKKGHVVTIGYGERRAGKPAIDRHPEDAPGSKRVRPLGPAPPQVTEQVFSGAARPWKRLAPLRPQLLQGAEIRDRDHDNSVCSVGPSR